VGWPGGKASPGRTTKTSSWISAAFGWQRLQSTKSEAKRYHQPEDLDSGISILPMNLGHLLSGVALHK